MVYLSDQGPHAARQSRRHRAPEDFMRILLCNDDGYQALGIQTLARVLRAAGHDTLIVAPSEERSGQSHAMTFFRPVLARQVSQDTWSIYGTPADCAAIALQNLLQGNPPDIVVSGINHGLNVGWDVNYSGTVGAATEAALLGYKAIAVSVDLDAARSPAENEAFFEAAAQIVVRTLARASQLTWAPLKVLNINHPGAHCRGLRSAASGGYSMYVPHVVEMRSDEHVHKNLSVFMLGGNQRRTNDDSSQDVTLVQQGFCTFSMLDARQSSLPESESAKQAGSAAGHPLSLAGFVESL
jgi:5'-nucleotidase